MLPETVVRYDPDFSGFAGDPAEESLIDLFLNPVEFDDDGDDRPPTWRPARWCAA